MIFLFASFFFYRDRQIDISAKQERKKGTGEKNLNQNNPHLIIIAIVNCKLRKNLTKASDVVQV